MTQDEWRESLLRRMELLEDQMKEMSVRMSSVEVQDAADSVVVKALDKRLQAIESSLSWLTKLIATALIGALMAFVLSGGLVV